MPFSITRKLRSSLGLSQEVFARLVGRSLASIRMYETGRMPPFEVLGKMLMIARSNPGNAVIEHEIETIVGDMFRAADINAGQPLAPQEELIDAPERAGFHAMLDYIIDNGRRVSAEALCEAIRVFYSELRAAEADPRQRKADVEALAVPNGTSAKD
jgi:transcriptional regulator with XRE-family HTH domain